MRNVTVSMKEEVARWVRIHAAHEGKSVSRVLGEIVEQHMRDTEAYDTAMERFLSRARAPVGGTEDRPGRDALYDRGADSWARVR